MSRDTKVPIKVGGLSAEDSNFGGMKDKFDEEMKRMEEVMDKFRGDMLDKESNFFSSSTSSSSNTNGNDMLRGSGLGTHSNWISGLDDSPSGQSGGEVKEGGGKSSSGNQKELKLRFDVSSYLPEEIMVKTIDNKLMVHAEHEEKAGGKTSFRQYNREFLLPEGTDPELIKSSPSKDGILTVEAPLFQPAIESNK
uniref:Heat shock protein beta-1 n=1 Tax=Caligus clemensi TaxID=344056 RepID=C1C116_CALCM|nr:Heat shock protein beta-1 [Caligus clemensi]